MTYFLMILVVALAIVLAGCAKAPTSVSKTTVVDKAAVGNAAVTPEDAEISGGLDNVKQLDNLSDDLEQDVNFDDLEKMTVE